jgi:hypothetical protein
MEKIKNLRGVIEQGKFPNNFPEFGGANLIISKNPNRNHKESDLFIHSVHASALSWLVIELKKIYDEEINYLNKYNFYISIGEIIKNTLKKQEYLFETMLFIVDEIENEWGTK